ncbi:hypothetical protein E2C01_021936 [Portunus trituberculatus]|uniref:Uncharacterized protein n=1 Tax=Portunus trituberculatus TaxID=210409 RepID=A0A5B7E689_PORTR|nr:hypothetical protein [Portunus trituberculatus]
MPDCSSGRPAGRREAGEGRDADHKDESTALMTGRVCVASSGVGAGARGEGASWRVQVVLAARHHGTYDRPGHSWHGTGGRGGAGRACTLSPHPSPDSGHPGLFQSPDLSCLSLSLPAQALTSLSQPQSYLSSTRSYIITTPSLPPYTTSAAPQSYTTSAAPQSYTPSAAPQSYTTSATRQSYTTPQHPTPSTPLCTVQIFRSSQPGREQVQARDERLVQRRVPGSRDNQTGARRESVPGVRSEGWHAALDPNETLHPPSSVSRQCPVMLQRGPGRLVPSEAAWRGVRGVCCITQQPTTHLHDPPVCLFISVKQRRWEAGDRRRHSKVTRGQCL